MKKIVSFLMAVAMLMSLCSFSTTATTEDKALYENIFVEYLRKYAEGHDDEDFDWYDYEEFCYYYAESDSVKAIADETEAPDFVLVKARVNMCSPMPAVFVVGDYIFYAENLYVPYAIELYVYTPADNKIYTLEQAVPRYSYVIEKFFAEGYIDAKLLGDMDNDTKITVKDATYIQKCLAGITAFDTTDELRWLGYMVHEQNMPCFYSDFNRDGERNIKDATAIQKHIAGITE